MIFEMRRQSLLLFIRRIGGHVYKVCGVEQVGMKIFAEIK
jgi:hypothetical protein